jgi:hypothetical protein
MGIEEEEVNVKGVGNIFNKVKPENFPNFEKEILIQVQEAVKVPSRQDQNRPFPKHILFQTLSTADKEGILKANRKTTQLT